MTSHTLAAAPPRAGAHNRSWNLREAIEDEIATGRLSPGTRLDETELAHRFGVSRTPVREALIQLASMGQVEMRARRGAVVPEVSPQRLVEMFEVMAELEAMCGRLAARRMSDAERAALVKTHEACGGACQRGDTDAYYYENEAFHHAIYAGTHSAFLSEQAVTLHRRLGPYRRLQLRVRDRMVTSYREHQRIVDGLLAGDAEVAADALRAHVLVQGDRFGDLMSFLGQR
jgi:DNA-binding GntR family transcriptional regulator